MAKKKPETITFEYKISPNFAVYAVCGAFGGLNSHGEIIMTLYNEKAAIPERQTYSINDDGSIDKKPIGVEKKENIIRHVMFGISMNPSVARSVGQWLIEKADAYDRYAEGT
ncbi:MAG: hypothetical protein JRJ47_05265 [Deltaproteobacteria bacterium]|nr:hypothetical protein [Deltaproteobacteria bacterium]